MNQNIGIHDKYYYVYICFDHLNDVLFIGGNAFKNKPVASVSQKINRAAKVNSF